MCCYIFGDEFYTVVIFEENLDEVEFLFDFFLGFFSVFFGDFVELYLYEGFEEVFS